MVKRNVTRRSFMKGLALTTLGAASAGVMAACAAPAPSGGESTDAAGSSSAPAATDVELRIQTAAGSLTIMPTEFTERFTSDTGIPVTIEETIYGEIETKTQTGFISGTLQDVVYGHHRWIFINFLKGIYLELDDLFASDPPPDFDDIYPSVLAGNQFEGKNFNLPETVHPGGNIAINYNKTMLEEKGIPLPEEGWTFADWTELAKAAADPDNGIFGLGFDSMSAMHYYSNTSRSWGAPDSNDSWIMDADGTTMSYATPLHAEIAAWYLDLLESKVAPRQADYLEGSAGNLFTAGFSATHASTVGNATNFLDKIGDGFEMDAVSLPVGAEGRQGTCYSGNHYMVNSASEHLEESYELLKYLTSIEAGIYMVLESKGQPNGHKAAWTDEAVNDVNRMFGVTDRLITEGVEPYPMPSNTRFTEANDIFRNEIDLIWEGEEPWETYAPEIDAKVQAILDLGRPD